MHGRKGCDEPEPKFTSQGLQEERHNAMIANGGIAANSSHSLLVRPSARCAFFILMGDWGGGTLHTPLLEKMIIICVGI